MSSEHHAAPKCPTCKSTLTMLTADGLGLCFECRTQWDPRSGEVVKLRGLEPFGMAPTEEVFGAEPSAADRAIAAVSEEYADRLAEVAATELGRLREIDVATGDELETFIEETDEVAANLLESMKGTWVVLEGGQHAAIVDFIDSDFCMVRLQDGREERVSVNDIERSVASQDDVAEVFTAIPDDVAYEFTTAVTMCAGMILKAGIAATRVTDDGIEITQPPFGYLPDTDDAMPLVEQAAAFAVATMIQVYKLDAGQLLVALEAAEAAQAEGNRTTEDEADGNEE